MFFRLKILFASVTFLFLLVSFGFSQIPNSGFENWTGSDPTGWATSNAPVLYTNVTPSTDAHTGSYAVRGDAVLIYTMVIEPVIQSGPGGHGFAYSQKPLSFTGYYKFFPQSGDRFGINVELFNGGETGTLVAIAAAAPSTAYSAYTKFDVPFIYQTNDTPDLCIVQILIAAPYESSAVHAGSYFILDDIAFSGSVGVSEKTDDIPTKTELIQNYQNPFNPTTDIQFSIAHAGFVSLKVFDLLGREVATLVSEELPAGNHTRQWDASAIPSGVYFYRMITGSSVETKKLILQK
jgi:hypothetical protein